MKKLIYLSFVLLIGLIYITPVSAQHVTVLNKKTHLVMATTDMDAYNFQIPVPGVKSKPSTLTVFTFTSGDQSGTFKASMALIRRLNKECAKVRQPNKMTLWVVMVGRLIKQGCIPTLTDYQLRYTTLNELIARGLENMPADTTQN